MAAHSIPTSKQLDSSSSPPSLLTNTPQRPGGQGDWWFRISAPQEPPNATFAQREAVRRGKLASLTLLFISLFTLMPIPVALIEHETGFVIVQIITFLLDAFALFVFNRRGQLVAAGWMVMLVIELSYPLALLAIPQGVSLDILPVFDVVVESLMVVVAFFSPRSIFVVMALNIGFIISWLFLGKHTPDMSSRLAANAYNLLFIPVSLEIYAAVLIFLWANSATKAIADLDRSEEIIALERRQIEQQEKEVVLKQQLEEGVAQILQTHVQAANGNFSARAPLAQDNVLWQVAYSLNNLLSRLQHHGKLQAEMRRTQEAVRLLTEHVRAAKANKLPLSLQRTGTMVDELIIELMVSPGPESSFPQKRPSSSLTNERIPNTPREPYFNPRNPYYKEKGSL